MTGKSKYSDIPESWSLVKIQHRAILKAAFEILLKKSGVDTYTEIKEDVFSRYRDSVYYIVLLEMVHCLRQVGWYRGELLRPLYGRRGFFIIKGTEYL